MRALCPFCELPRGELMAISWVTLASCPCIPRDRPMLISIPLRFIPMPENHDPGDEDNQ